MIFVLLLLGLSFGFNLLNAQNVIMRVNGLEEPYDLTPRIRMSEAEIFTHLAEFAPDVFEVANTRSLNNAIHEALLLLQRMKLAPKQGGGFPVGSSTTVSAMVNNKESPTCNGASMPLLQYEEGAVGGADRSYNDQRFENPRGGGGKNLGDAATPHSSGYAGNADRSYFKRPTEDDLGSDDKNLGKPEVYSSGNKAEADRSFFKQAYNKPFGGDDKNLGVPAVYSSGNKSGADRSYFKQSYEDTFGGNGKNLAQQVAPQASSFTGSYDTPDIVALNGPIVALPQVGISYDKPQMGWVESSSPRVDPNIDVAAVNDMGKAVDYISSMGLIDPAYWVWYDSKGQYSDKVIFVIMPIYHDAPFAGIKQVFKPKSDMNIVTPFGVPFWGGNKTSGPWILIAANDRGNVTATPLIIE